VTVTPPGTASASAEESVDDGELSVEPANTQAKAFRCPSCAADMTYDAGARALACDYCGTRVEIGGGDASHAIVEHDLEKGLATAARGFGVALRRARCQDCGAVVTFGDSATATRCDFCDSPKVMPQEDSRQVLRPESLVPFAINSDGARAAFGGWLGKLWFRPSDLKHRASVVESTGMYVPYWTFDCHADSSWTAESGTYYYVDESYSVTVNGKRETRTRRVRKVRWRPAWGRRDDDYDDLLVCASRGLPADLAARLETFDTAKLVPYDPAFLAGWKAEEYAVELNDGWSVASARVERSQVQRCGDDVPGDTHRFLRVDTQLSDETFKHVLLPVWIAAYRYRDKVYRFLVNGQTGEVTGVAPWSWAKILLTVLVVIALVGAGVALWSGAH
jgi:ribosomal protein S27E